MTPKHNRRGVGVVFIFVIGTIVVLCVLMMSQYFSGRSATHEVATSDLGNRANIIAESATEECAYFAMTSTNDFEKRSAEGGQIYEKLRSFNKSSDKTPSIAGPTGKGLKFLWTVNYGIPRTKNFYSNKDYAGDAALSDFTIGALQQTTYPDGPAEGNESYGILGMEGSVTVNARGGGSDIVRKVQFAKNFRVLLLHPPYPFNNYTLYIKRPSLATADRFHEYFDNYENSGATGLPPFPVADMTSDERPIVTTAAEIRPDAYVVTSLDPNSGTNLSALSAQDQATLQAEMNRMKAAAFKKLDAGTSSNYVNDGYYRQLSWQAFKNKASHYYPDFGRFIYDNSKDGELNVNGLYYIEKGVSFAHSFRGRGVIVTTSTEDVVIRSLSKANPQSRLTIVTINSNFDFKIGGSSTAEVEADLFAPAGTIKNAGNAKIIGCVYLSHIEPGSAVGPWVVRPPDTKTKPWTGGALDEKYGQKLGVFVAPGYAWKRIWSRRGS